MAFQLNLVPLGTAKVPHREERLVPAIGTGNREKARCLVICCAQLFPSALAPGPGRYATHCMAGKTETEGLAMAFPIATAMSQRPVARGSSPPGDSLTI